MKQHINKEQLAELSLGGQNKLHSWFIENQQVGEVYKLFHPTDLDNEKPSVSMMCTDFENCPTIILNENYYPELEYPQHENWECLPLLSIGQMIEFLEDSGHWTHNKSMVSLNLREDSITNICNNLWEAVKEVLEKPNSSS